MSQIMDPEEKIYLETNSPIPLYYQMQRIIEQRIAKRNDATMLPTENQMMNIFGVSRSTVRKALDLLEQDGTIVRMRGKGTAVRKDSVMEEPLTYPRSYTEQVLQTGHTPVRQFVSLEVTDPDDDLKLKLKLKTNEKLIKYTRLCGHEEVFPIVYFESFIPESLGITIPDCYDDSLYKLFKEHNQEVVSGDVTIRAKLATRKTADLLKIEKGSPLLYFERISYNKTGVPVEFVTGRYVAEHYKYVIKIG